MARTAPCAFLYFTRSLQATQGLGSRVSASSAKFTKVLESPAHSDAPESDPCMAVTGPVARFARQIAGQGYIVAAPSSYHDFVGPEPLKYDVEDTDRGNKFKIEKTLESYDADSHATVDYLLSLPTCTGLIGSTGMCLGGHLAVRAALDPRITACVSYFATDIHSRTLGPYTAANSSPSAPANSNHTIDHLSRLGGEVAMIFGIKTPTSPTKVAT
ncbi:hypothetical protein J3459_011960 [Metarhizium acridum]|nr:hypothetical protein J3459_011960 [Metarhizium acridum]